ncbi:hypothetical protein Zmor_026444 [Zophobas morio]|uniref:Zinc-finger domain-containing protein n=1 Tax=Zophobas morio TaxID=2755281 RepID=A0AA38HUC2_9CUCU|nr:hypothetical protein Zmor_026444 [Zophobas morio]
MGENPASDQLEEGEIVDDDFEDISDNSIIETAFGKLATTNECLRALSLSSDSEIEKQIRYKRKSLHRKSKIKQKRRKKIRISSDSSDSDTPNHDLKGKLNQAIHISGIEGGHKNTLETRLKAMGGLAASSEPAAAPPELELEVPPQDKNEETSDRIDDAELENLRMEALKTAVLNKCQRRKRKRALETQETVTPLQMENKENNTPKDEKVKDGDEKVVVIGESANDVEEDEDVLRASLLAGLAKKIAKKQTPNENVMQVKQVTATLPVSIVPALPKRPVTKFKTNTLIKQVVNNKVINKHVIANKMIQNVNRPKPQVKPLIINVNGDSDSEEELKPKAPQTVANSNPAIHKLPDITVSAPQKITDLKAITTNVEKFLKEQRAKFENETKKNAPPTPNGDKTILEKSAVKLLPKSQQIEYQQLLKRLRNAERKKKAKKLALAKKVHNVAEPPKVNNVTVEIAQKAAILEIKTEESAPKIEVVVQPMTSPIERKTSYEESIKSDSSFGDCYVKSSKASDTSESRRSAITTELTTLQRTLKEMKMHGNGSFQIRTKYQVLTPIIRKITATSNERKKQEQRIKTLLQDLNDARSNLAKSHEKFSILVRELVSKKEKIDKSCQELKAEKHIQNGKIAKNRKLANKDQRESKIENNNKEMKTLPVTSTPIKLLDVNDDAAPPPFVTSSTNNDCEDMDVCNSDETDICQIDIVDPNDIDQIFKRRPPMKSTIPEYISPLNYNTYERYRNVDPHGIMCPYEVNGSCRDIDCTYKHYLKNHERL